jgi:hypothetical protein
MNRSWSTIRRIQAIALITMVLSATAFAAPQWEGTGGTVTSQQWSFASDSYTPSPDDGWINQEEPICMIGDRAQWLNGAWTLGMDEMDIFIPNDPQLRPKKEMQIELIWSAVGENRLPDRPLVSVFPEYEDGRVVFPDISILEQTSIPGSNLMRTIFWVNIEPNPMSELIVIKGDIRVDSITVDTRCIPEPATFGLLIGGAIMAIRRKLKA